MDIILKELTIIIPTKNRLFWIKRILEYYSKNFFLGKLILADSSENHIHLDIIKLTKNYQNLNIKVLYVPNYNCDMAINAACEIIDTEYSVYLADDDLILIVGLSEAIKYLNNNMQYSGAVGKSYMISTLNNQPFGKISNLTDYNLRSYDDNDKLKRLNSYFNDTRALCFAVTRTKIFIESYKNIMKLDRLYQTYVFGENLQAAVYLGNGKIINTQNDYLVRQAHPENTYHKMDFQNWSNSKGFEDSENYLSNYIKNLFNFKKDYEIDLMIKSYFKKFKSNFVKRKNNNKYLFSFKNFKIRKILKIIKYYLYDIGKLKKFKKNKDLENYLNIVEFKRDQKWSIT